jgi:phosphatidylglycerophosphate synthase
LLFKMPLAGFPTHDVGLVLLYIAAALTLWSMVVYMHAAWPLLSGKSENPPENGA